MIDSIAIANLQMLMNTGDGRHAVLTELLQTEKRMRATTSKALRVAKSARTTSVDMRTGVHVEIQGNPDRRLRLMSSAMPSARRQTRLTDNIIQMLDRITPEDKEPLIRFSQGLAYHYNNLFMAIVGYISIVMFNLKPSHPSYDQLRECEELIHNTSLLIRLLVDVFHRPQCAPTTVYPIDLSDHEIGDRIFFNFNKRTTSVTIASKDIDVKNVLRMVAAAMAWRLKNIFQVLRSQIEDIFESRDLRVGNKEHRQQIRIHLCSGISIADSLLEFARPALIRKRPLDLVEIAREVVANESNRFSRLQIKLKGDAQPVPVQGHAQLLHKMLIELLVNSDEACTKGGSVYLKIRRRCRLEHTDWFPESHNVRKAQLIIEDSGPGLPECLGLQAFDPFTSSPGGRQRLGLGLAVVGGIVRAHGGRIRYSNRHKGGFSMTIELPLA
jgi:signal transduction histidine kinase